MTVALPPGGSGEQDAAKLGARRAPNRPEVSQLALRWVPGGSARIPGTGGSMHLVVPPLRNTTSHVRPGGGSSRAGSATNHIVATASPRTRIMSGTTGLGSLSGPLARARATARPLTSSTADFAADTYATSAVCRPEPCPVWGTRQCCLARRHRRRLGLAHQRPLCLSSLVLEGQRLAGADVVLC